MEKNVNSKVVINTAAIRKLGKTAQEALVATAESIHTDILDAGVVPRDTGALEESMFVDDSESHMGTVAIITNTPYSRRLYYHPEYNFHREPWVDDKGKEHKDCNPNAGGEWYKPWAEGGEHEEDVQKYFELHMRRLMR